MPTPLPTYTAKAVVRGGVTRWQQIEELDAAFDGSSAQVDVTWESFGARPFRIYCGPAVTDDTSSISVQVVASSVSPTGCTLQAAAAFVGTVPVEVKEILP